MVDFQHIYGSLNKSQREAVENIDGPLLVVAGPGTGKTHLLTARIANILRKTDVLPSNILCLTFTESAVTTMRERLVGMIGKAAHEVTISTYHAFGNDILHKYPEHFMLSPDLQPIDDLTVDVILRSILSRLPYSNPLRHDIFLRDIKTFISDVKRAILTPNDLRKIGSANVNVINEINTIIGSLFKNFVRLDKSSAQIFETLLSKTRSLSSPKPASTVVSLHTIWQQQLETAVHHFKDTQKTNELRIWKDDWLEKDNNGHFCVNGKEQVRRLRAAADIYDQYLKALQAQNLYDYDDMILFTISGLTNHNDLRYTLQERYQYILLDEFQDTNEAQFRLVELLTNNPVYESRPNIMAVGDDDQAIYAFQGANYSHMAKFFHLYRDVKIISLTENYRSTKDVLDLANGIAGQIAERLQSQIPSISKTIISKNKFTIDAHKAIGRYEFKSNATQNAWIAQHIHTLVAKGQTYSDIAIISPKHEFLEELVPYLQQANIPVNYDKRENVLEDTLVRQLYVMSQLIVTLADNHPQVSDALWPQVLSFDFWQISTENIWRLSWESADTSHSWTDILMNHAKFKKIATLFLFLSQNSKVKSLEEILDILIGIQPLEHGGGNQAPFRSPFYQFYFGSVVKRSSESASYWSLLTNLSVIRQHLRDYRQTELEPLYIQDFISFIEQHQSADLKIINTSPYQEAADAVELLTVYKSKGQEYNTIFIISSIDEVWGSRARQLGSRLSIPKNLQYMRYAGATEDERLRLLYVAITRAKTHLYLASYRQTMSGRQTNRIKYLNEFIDEDKKIISPLLPLQSRVVHEQDVSPPNVDVLTVFWQSRHYQAASQLTLAELLRPRLNNFKLSPTQLNQFVDVISGGPEIFLIKYLLRFPTAITPSEQYGISIHHTLEWIHLYNQQHGSFPSISKILSEFTTTLKQKRLHNFQFDLLVDRGRNSLSAYAKQRRHTVQSSNYGELNFRNEHINLGKAQITGKIDKLIIDSKNKTLTIVDFKTGKSYQRWIRDPKLIHFKTQLYFYKMLVERSPQFHNYQVSDAYIEFVEPDNTGLIHELHLSFNNNEQKTIELLIQAVWQRLQHLDFPDITDFSKDAKGIVQFEDWLISNKK